MPMAKQARQIRTEKLGLVHPLPSVRSFLGKLDIYQRYPFFGQISAKKVEIIKHEWTPEIYKIKLHCIVIILYRMHTTPPPQKKTYPSQSSCKPLDAIIVSHVYKTTRSLPKFLATKPTQQIATREQIELHPSQRDFSSPVSHIY